MQISILTHLLILKIYFFMEIAISTSMIGIMYPIMAYNNLPANKMSNFLEISISASWCSGLWNDQNTLISLTSQSCYMSIGHVWDSKSYARFTEPKKRFYSFQVSQNGSCHDDVIKWKHYWMKTLLALCAGNSPVTGEFPSQRPVTRSFDVFFDLRLNKRLSKQSRGWRFETPSRPLWPHHNVEHIPLSCWMGSTVSLLVWTVDGCLRKRINVTWVYFRTTHNCELKSQLCV